MSTATPLRFVKAAPPRKQRFRVLIGRGKDVREFHVRPWAAVSLGVFGILFGVFYFAATGYLVFRDDLLAASFARQARIQQAYEDRIASLRSDIDRLTSRQLLNQEAFEGRLAELLGRQAALDARQDIIASLSQTIRGSGLVKDTAPLPRPRPTNPADPDPITTGSVVPRDTTPKLAVAELRRDTTASPMPASNEVNRIVAAESSIDTLAREQVDYVTDIAAEVTERSARIAAVLDKLGQMPKIDTGGGDAVGGPFLALDEDADPEAFRANVEAVEGQIEQLATLRAAATRLPLAKPIPNAPITSRFGRRVDPFLRRPAMHAGIDFKASTGFPIRATGGGKVTTAQYSGGYGNMVVIDHGGGVMTRYGHMSKLLVKKGAYVEQGTIIGQIGSTGRSTGPHLHYEIRLNGRAIDPMGYIKAGAELTPLL
ncbi:M23 family metallopeptidase [Bauldia litoralis]|uniref:Murein DD-endopeptidase MepM and murein hydrolase activator NlpD, contain LysM domain n=1 Tax=Bauldia litoralis TaxID=665467 RepID=A0A1G6ASJ8_9HYPH|nr:M23 family metallopeptidase [Bauldia litoralis]SDB11321.1 Murein DD-endopeptidase MepM and murein hydrolase activator NlpD, contain LysM domain [Bauldia litoralis]